MSAIDVIHKDMFGDNSAGSGEKNEIDYNKIADIVIRRLAGENGPKDESKDESKDEPNN